MKDNYIVLTGEAQLKTLESRARKLIINPYSKQEVLNYMSEYYVDDNLKEKLYLCGLNTPGKVEINSKYENIENLADYAIEIFKKITCIGMEDIIAMLNRFEFRYKEIDACLLFLNMLIGLIESNIQNLSYYSYYDIVNILIEGKTSLLKEPTLNRKFLLYSIFYQIYQIQQNQFSSLNT